MFAEFLESAPTIIAVWMAINLPFLTSSPEINDRPDPDDENRRTGPTNVAKEEAGRYAEDVRNEFLRALPASLGRNIVAISSDLHYLHVYSDLGRCMILGSLQRATEAMGDEGMRIHRAHWVARRSIVRIVKDGTQWYCC